MTPDWVIVVFVIIVILLVIGFCWWWCYGCEPCSSPCYPEPGCERGHCPRDDDCIASASVPSAAGAGIGALASGTAASASALAAKHRKLEQEVDSFWQRGRAQKDEKDCACSSLSALSANCSGNQCRRVVYLRQSDFANGPYRCRSPNTTYKLLESIIYNPPPNSDSKNNIITGQICAISIEACGIVLDGNGYTLSAGPNIYTLAPANSTASAPYLNFSLVLLANSALPAFISNAIPGGLMRFPDETKYVAGRDVVIKDIRLRDSPHFGIYGPGGHHHVYLNCVSVVGALISGITLNSTEKVCLHNVFVDGTLSQPQNLHLPYSQLLATLALASLVQAGLPEPDETLAGFITDLTAATQAAFVLDVEGAYNENVPTISRYGIVLQNGPTSSAAHSGAAIVNNAQVDAFDSLTGMTRIGHAHVRNVKVQNIVTNQVETPLLAYGPDTYTGNSKPWGGVQGAPLGIVNVNPLVQALSWAELGVSGANVTPSLLLQANLYLMMILQTTAATTVNYVDPDLVALLLGPGPITLNSVVPYLQPFFGAQASGDYCRGANGIMVRGFGSLNTCEVKVTNIVNQGARGLTLADIPGGATYVDVVDPVVYIGGGAWSIFLQAAHLAESCHTEEHCHKRLNVKGCGVCVDGVTSAHGDAFALQLVDIPTFSIENVKTSALSALDTATADPPTNPDRHSYIYEVDDASLVSQGSRIGTGGPLFKFHRLHATGDIVVAPPAA